MAALPAGVRTVKMGADTVLEVAKLLPALRLKDMGSAPRPHPRIPFAVGAFRWPFCLTSPPPPRLHLAKFEKAVLGLLLAFRHAVTPPIPPPFFRAGPGLLRSQVTAGLV